MMAPSDGIDVIVTIDTEADDQWTRGVPITTRNLQHVPRFQELCDKYGLKPTYLCTYEIVEDPVFDDTVKVYQDRGRAEVGTHLHPWTTPPLEDNRYDLNSRAYPSELDDELFRAKLEVLTNAIGVKTGASPTSFRAGRWGLAPSHVPILLDLGYTVDTSVTPLATWVNQPGDKDGGPDFRHAPLEPYYLDPRDLCRPGGSPLLEVPVTIVCAKERAYKLATSLFRKPTSFGYRLCQKLIRFELEWFRPFPYMTAERMQAVYETAVARGVRVVDFMFHSSELMPGGSPYNPTEESIEALYERFDRLFDFVTRNGGRGITLSGYADTFNTERSRT